MSKKLPPLLLTFLAIVLLSCKDQKEDLTDTVNKNGSIETAVQVEHLDSSRDVLITSHKVWVHHDVYKNIQYRDTIPSLGVQNTTAENDEGDTKNVSIPKDYEIFITVK